jgi:ATP-dependent Clp protease ATP-binding subunit ClpA
VLTEGLQSAAERALYQARAVAADTGAPTVRSDVVLLALAAQAPARPLMAALHASAEASYADAGTSPTEPPFDPEVLEAVAQAWRFALLLAADRPGSDHLLLGLLSERTTRSAQVARAAGVVFEDAFQDVTGWDRAPAGFAPAPFDVAPA